MALPAAIKATEHDLWLRFESNNVIDIERLAAFLREVGRLARTPSYYGRGATVTLRRLDSESPTTLMVQVLDAAGNLAGVGQLGIGILVLAQESRERLLSKSLAAIMVHDDVYELNALFRDPSGEGARRVTVSREAVPAVAQLVAQREERNLPSRQLLPTESLVMGDELADQPKRLLATGEGKAMRTYPPKTTAQRSLILVGRFVRVADGPGAVFETADSVLDVMLAGAATFAQLPYDRMISVSGVIDGDKFFVDGWSESGGIKLD